MRRFLQITIFGESWMCTVILNTNHIDGGALNRDYFVLVKQQGPSQVAMDFF